MLGKGGLEDLPKQPIKYKKADKWDGKDAPVLVRLTFKVTNNHSILVVGRVVIIDVIRLLLQQTSVC
jgi:hypothetical protein